MGTNINATERNTLPVLYSIKSSTVILSQHQHYIHIYTVYIPNTKPYNGHKMRQPLKLM